MFCIFWYYVNNRQTNSFIGVKGVYLKYMQNMEQMLLEKNKNKKKRRERGNDKNKTEFISEENLLLSGITIFVRQERNTTCYPA